MGKPNDEPLFTDAEFAIALAELTALGLVEWKGDEQLRLTSKGIDRGLELKDKLGGTDWVLLELLHERIRGAVSEEGV